MSRKRHRPEEIVAKLRQVEVLTAQGQSVAEALKGGQVLDGAGEHARAGAAPAVPPTGRVRQAPRCKDPRTGLGGGERCLRRSNAPCGAFPRVR